MKLVLLSSLLISIVLSFLPDIIPFLSTTNPLSGDEIKYIGSLAPYEVPCGVETVSISCKKAYRIPESLLFERSEIESVTLGLGLFLTTPFIQCNGPINPEKFSKASAGYLIESYKIYKTVDIQKMHCPDGNVLVLALNRPGFPTYGQISSNAVAGNSEIVSQVKRSVEFFLTSIFVFYAIFFALSILVTKYLIAEIVSGGDRFIWLCSSFLPFWFLFAVFKSGFLEFFMPGISHGDQLFRIQTWISMNAHIGPMLSVVLSRYKFKNSVLATIIILSLIYVPFSITKFFNLPLAYLVTFFPIVFIFLETYFKKIDLVEFVFGIFVFCEGLKIFGIHGLPFGPLALTFTVIYEMHLCLLRVRNAGVVSKANFWIKGVLSQSSHNAVLGALESFVDNTGAKRISFLSIKENMIKLHIFDADTGYLENVLSEVPPVFSHVLSLGYPIWHEKADSLYSQNLFKGKEVESLGAFYSLIPVLGLDYTIAIAVSKYGLSRFRKGFDKYSVQVFLDELARASLDLSRHDSDEHVELVEKAIDKIIHLDLSKVSATDLFNQLCHEINKQLGWDVWVGVYDQTYETIDAISVNFSSELAKETITLAPWKFTADNVRGPGPLALFQNKIVTVPNSLWVTGTASERTMKFIHESASKSFGVVPIYSLEETTGPFGIIWISSGNAGEINSNLEASLVRLKSFIEMSIQNISDRRLKTLVLSDFVRDDIRNRLMKGENPKESGVGYLLMIDIIGSTKLSLALGIDKWKNYQQKYLQLCKTVGSFYGLKAEMLIYDAVFLTSQDPQLPEQLDSIIKNINEEYKRIQADEHVSGLRFVLNYGDISREMKSGVWTIIGSAMPEICKAEVAAKQFDEKIIVTEAAAGKWETKISDISYKVL